MSPERKLRFLQVVDTLFLAGCFLVKRVGTVETHGTVATDGWVVVMAIWSAISGFTLQRRINRTSAEPRNRPRKSTPLGRWRAGHIWRLSSATSVGLWALVLHYFGGSEWLVNALFGLAFLLLLVWRPGDAPAPQS